MFNRKEYMKTYKEKHRIKTNKQAKKYRETHREQIKDYKKEYQKTHKLVIKEKKHEYYIKNKEKINNISKKYQEIHKEEISEQRKEFYKINNEQIKQNSKDYYQEHKEERINYTNEHKEELKEYNKQHHKGYYIKNKEKIIERVKIYQINKLKTDVNFRILRNLRNRIWYALKRNTKSEHTIELLGCSIDQLKQHLQSKFKQGMTWSNYGSWHVDHMIPCASFDLSKESEQRECFNYKNLQPLWAIDNLRKSKKGDYIG